MNGICRVFLAVCNMSLTAVFVIALVLLARMIMKKMPRRFSYYLWVIVAFRLICPYSWTE
jgi:beta-lactamase regulating signal transducer with metallopeptidase domain